MSEDETECFCIYCSVTISNKYRLERHYKSKRCLINQDEYKKNKLIDELHNSTQIINEYKRNEIKYKQIINEYKRKENKYEEKINQLENKIDDLEDWKQEQFEKMDETNTFLLKKATEPKKIIKNTQTNNQTITIVNPSFIMDLSKEHLTNVFEKLKVKDLRNGIEGLAQFTFDHIIKNKENNMLGLLCTDKSRGTFKFRGDNNEIITDIQAKKFTETLLPYAKDPLSFIMKKLIPPDDASDETLKNYSNFCRQIMKLKKDGTESVYWNALAKLTYASIDERTTKIEIEKNNEIKVENKETKDQIRDNLLYEKVKTKINKRHLKKKRKKVIDLTDIKYDVVEEDPDEIYEKKCNEEKKRVKQLQKEKDEKSKKAADKYFKKLERKNSPIVEIIFKDDKNEIIFEEKEIRNNKQENDSEIKNNTNKKEQEIESDDEQEIESDDEQENNTNKKGQNIESDDEQENNINKKEQEIESDNEIKNNTNKKEQEIESDDEQEIESDNEKEHNTNKKEQKIESDDEQEIESDNEKENNTNKKEQEIKSYNEQKIESDDEQENNDNKKEQEIENDEQENGDNNKIKNKLKVNDNELKENDYENFTIKEETEDDLNNENDNGEYIDETEEEQYEREKAEAKKEKEKMELKKKDEDERIKKEKIEKNEILDKYEKILLGKNKDIKNEIKNDKIKNEIKEEERQEDERIEDPIILDMERIMKADALKEIQRKTEGKICLGDPEHPGTKTMLIYIRTDPLLSKEEQRKKMRENDELIAKEKQKDIDEYKKKHQKIADDHHNETIENLNKSVSLKNGYTPMFPIKSIDSD